MLLAVLSVVAGVALSLVGWFAFSVLRELLEKSAATDVICPVCKSKSTHASSPRGFVDWVFALFAYDPYRCDICNYRFYVRLRAPSARVTT
jgi:hypothetical protein